MASSSKFFFLSLALLAISFGGVECLVNLVEGFMRNFCEKSIFNLAQQFRMSFKDFSILNSGSHFVLLFW